MTKCPPGECVLVEAPAAPPHYGQILCDVCGAFHGWLPKPDREKKPRPAAHRELAKRFGLTRCEFCGLDLADLKRLGRWLEGHHVDEFRHGGEPTKENVRGYCNACHRLVHVIRLYAASDVESDGGEGEAA